MSKVWVLVAAAALAAAPGSFASGTCAGEACAAISTGACTITNKADRSVQVTTVADQIALMMTVLAPGETVKQDKGLCDKFSRGEAHYDARFAALRPMPDAPDFTLKTATAKPAPKPKPAPAAEPAAATPATPVTVAAAIPRPKPAAPPAYPPAPRAKPVPPELASAQAPAASTVAAAPVSSTAPAAAVASTPADCGEACATILFKVVDNCLWVVNLHPRAVVFEAEASGRRMALNLEAADGEKADARTIALAKGQAAKDEAALHMRLQDPFQSAGSGIPVFRARLGGTAACVKERSSVTRFSARFVN